MIVIYQFKVFTQPASPRRALFWHTIDWSTIKDTESALSVSRYKLKNAAFLAKTSEDDVQLLKDSVVAL